MTGAGPEHDVVVIGAGHNGLARAATLARSGMRVQVVEARDLAGGCAVTEEAVGVTVNLRNRDHTMILASPLLAELGLAANATPWPALHLSGAGTHPNGGVWGAAGRNTALRVLRDLA